MSTEPMTETPTTDGIYEVPFEEYCQWDAVNASRLKLMHISPAHYKAGWSGDSQVLRFGRLAHCGKLEAACVPLRYCVMPRYELDHDNVTKKKDKAGYPEQSTGKGTSYYKGREAVFLKANSSREMVTEDKYREMVAVVEAIERNERAVQYLNAPGRTELSYIWTDAETGLRCKARADKVSYMAGTERAEAMTDLKTTADAGPAFYRDIWKFRYHNQAAHYVDGWEALTGDLIEFRIVAVSKSEPITVRSAPMGLDAILTGRRENREALHKVAECTASGEWPTLADPDEWSIPADKLDHQELFPGVEVVEE